MKTAKSKASAKAITAIKLYEHQQSAEDAYYKDGIRRFFLGWHRRAGKDTWSMDFAHRLMRETKGNYWHLFPFHVQAKRAIWNGIDVRDGVRFIDRAFPPEHRDKVNESELSINMYGSTWQMLGSDNYDRAVGSNPVAIIFSEWALCDPAAWDYFRPILMENKGLAIFITTFRGRNHAYRMYESVRELEDTWYADIRTINDTHRHDGSPIVSSADVEQARKEGMSESKIQEEFYCNPDAAASGAIFNRSYTRLCGIENTPAVPNNRVARIAWGMKDEGVTAIVFQGRHIIGVHPFLESNITDAAQSVARRHPNLMLVHHATNPDPGLFGIVDGHGMVKSPLESDMHLQHGHASAMLNTCEATGIAREALMDLAMGYAPFRNENMEDHQLVQDSMMQALAVMHTAQPYANIGTSRKPNWSRHDRSVI